MNRLRHASSRLVCRPICRLVCRLICAGIVAAALLPAAAVHAQGDYVDCFVTAGSLKLRDPKSGGTLATLEQGTQLEALARNARGTTLYVKVPHLGRRGWVNAGARDVQCDNDTSGLPVAEENPTGGQYQVRYLPTPGADPGDMIGWVYADGDYYFQPSLYSVEDDWYYGDEELTFRDSFSLGLFVYDPREGGNDGDGIDHVEFRVEDSDTGDEIYAESTDNGDVYNSEGNVPYCLFSDSNGECNTVQLDVGDTWPGTDATIQPGAYRIRIQAYPDKGYRQTGNWNLDIILE